MKQQPKIGRLIRLDDTEPDDEVKVINPFDPKEVEKEEPQLTEYKNIKANVPDYIDAEILDPDDKRILKRKIIQKVAGTPYERLTLIQMSIKNTVARIDKQKQELKALIQQEKKLIKIIDQLEAL